MEPMTETAREIKHHTLDHQARRLQEVIGQAMSLRDRISRPPSPQVPKDSPLGGGPELAGLVGGEPRMMPSLEETLDELPNYISCQVNTLHDLLHEIENKLF